MTGGEPQQAQTIEPHDHEGHFSWHHPWMIPLWVAIATGLSLVVCAWLKRRKSNVH